LRGNADGRIPLLRQSRVINDQPSFLVTNESIGLLPQRRFERRAVPHPSADEMMEPVVADGVYTSRHRLDALAIAGANQASDVRGAHPPTCLVAESIKIRSKPFREIVLPICIHSQPPTKLAPHESRFSRRGNPKNHISAKVVLASVDKFEPVSGDGIV
jgi:hypothetical protein